MNLDHPIYQHLLMQAKFEPSIKQKHTKKNYLNMEKRTKSLE